jgi:hypothetical protein
MQFSQDAKFLIVADAIGASNAFGRGRAYLYRKRVNNEVLYPTYLTAGLALGPVSLSGMTYDLIGTYAKRAGGINSTQYQADQFGMSIAVNKYFVVLGAPIDGCVHMFPMPVSVPITTTDPVLISVNSNQTVENVAPPPPPPVVRNFTVAVRVRTTASVTSITLEDEPTPTLPPQATLPPRQPKTDVTQASAEQGWLYALIAGIVGLVILLPIGAYLLIRWHRKIVLEQLKAQFDAANPNALPEETMEEVDEPSVEKSNRKFFSDVQ